MRSARRRAPVVGGDLPALLARSGQLLSEVLRPRPQSLIEAPTAGGRSCLSVLSDLDKSLSPAPCSPRRFRILSRAFSVRKFRVSDFCAALSLRASPLRISPPPAGGRTARAWDGYPPTAWTDPTPIY